MDQPLNDFLKSKNAIVIEDDMAIAQLLKLNLIQLGFSVDVCPSSESGLKMLNSRTYDLCLLDWMLPGIQGVDLLKIIRPQFKKLKIVMVTAKADADSIVTGFDCGADDYLTKPFDARVLAARIRNLMRQVLADQELTQAEDTISYNGLSVDLNRHIVKFQNNEIHLTPSEFKLLAELAKARGRVLTRDQLIDLIQGEDVSVTGRTIDTHVFALRKKIGLWSKHIETIRGVGYRILLNESDQSEPEESGL